MSLSLAENLPEIQTRINHARHVLLGLDYDGTLTPIVSKPGDATLPAETKEALESLTQLDKLTTALISGRALDDLRSLVNVDGLYYAGNHGMEIVGPDVQFIEPTAQAEQPALREIEQLLTAQLKSIPGVMVQDKGLTLSVHYRNVQEERHGEVKLAVETIVDQASGDFRLTHGNMVHEIRPPVDWHKGKALDWLNRRLAKPGTLVMFFGDDVTDEDAFQSLADGISVKVGVFSDTAARYNVAGPDQVRQFLQWLGGVLT